MLLKRFLLGILNFLRFIKHRERDFLDYKAIPQMKPKSWDIYCDKPTYTIGQNVEVYIQKHGVK